MLTCLQLLVCSIRQIFRQWLALPIILSSTLKLRTRAPAFYYLEGFRLPVGVKAQRPERRHRRDVFPVRLFRHVLAEKVPHQLLIHNFASCSNGEKDGGA